MTEPSTLSVILGFAAFWAVVAVFALIGWACARSIANAPETTDTSWLDRRDGVTPTNAAASRESEREARRAGGARC